jgi:hypothetical protein
MATYRTGGNQHARNRQQKNARNHQRQTPTPPPLLPDNTQYSALAEKKSPDHASARQPATLCSTAYRLCGVSARARRYLVAETTDFGCDPRRFQPVSSTLGGAALSARARWYLIMRCAVLWLCASWRGDTRRIAIVCKAARACGWRRYLLTAIKNRRMRYIFKKRLDLHGARQPSTCACLALSGDILRIGVDLRRHYGAIPATMPSV